MITESKSIGIFIDGGYFSKINEALSDQLSLNIKIKSLFDFIRAANICCFPSESLKTV